MYRAETTTAASGIHENMGIQQHEKLSTSLSSTARLSKLSRCKPPNPQSAVITKVARQRLCTSCQSTPIQGLYAKQIPQPASSLFSARTGMRLASSGMLERMTFATTELWHHASHFSQAFRQSGQLRCRLPSPGCCSSVHFRLQPLQVSTPFVRVSRDEQFKHLRP